MPEGKELCSVVIDGKEYEIPCPVMELMHMTSKERDYYRDIVKALETDKPIET